GGASLQARLEQVFWAAGIKIINMYGLTETSPIITINRQNESGMMLGSVGILINGVEVKIADDGEILCKGDNVMLGYYKDEKLSGEAIDHDGWFHTGDIGSLCEDGFLMVTDRKKEIFKLSSGKYIAPQVVEGRLKESAFIEQSMVIGDSQKFTGAIISPNFERLKSWAKENEHSFEKLEHLLGLKEVISLLAKEIELINSRLSQAEKIVKFRLVAEEWGPDSGELSPTLKLRRHFLMEKYQPLVDEIYKRKN
ncbi:MAG: AMP-binding protein, partial [Bacteroidales bacterium]|nr:AMP-binding protein [Bacteroidales bacterium]